MIRIQGSIKLYVNGNVKSITIKEKVVKKKLKKYQSKDSSGEVKTTKPSFTVPRGFDMKADSTIDPGFYLTDKQIEKMTGRPVIKNNDPGFTRKAPTTYFNGKPIVHKKKGGAIKSKKKK